ncbi:hypothetical protein [Nonomuraea sp. NPDC052265]|uniref:hypothetical protein n=1 Tax=Nonomuraea sp. NPDC052265 TaxID=3364374 RepID=UPI0037CAC262
MCLAHLPGYAPRGTPDPPKPASADSDTPTGALHYASDRLPPPEPAGHTHAANGGTPPGLAPIMATKEHKRFLEFADAVRRKRYVGLCFGAPGVGKTESARTYAEWDQLAPHLAGVRATGSDAGDADVHDVLSARAVMYTPQSPLRPTKPR